MAGSVRHFARLVRVELDDIADDIRCRIKRNEARFKREEITMYVHHENDALLRHELEAIGRYSAIVDGIDASNYNDIAAFEAGFLSTVGSVTHGADDPEAALLLLRRKLDKVRAYIASGESEPES